MPQDDKEAIGPPEFPGASVRKDNPVQHFSRRQIFFGLFFYPHVTLFLLQHNTRWTRALRMVMGVALLCGCLVGLSRLPGIYKSSQDWASWLSVEVKAVWVEDGLICWDQPRELPYTTRHRGWRIDFVKADTPFQPETLSGPERQGVWVGPEEVFTWWQDVQGKVVFFAFVTEKKVGGLFKLGTIWPDGYRIDGDNFNREARRIVLQAVPVILLREGIFAFFWVLTYALLFSLVPLLLRGRLLGGDFLTVFSFHLYASIPPLIVASVYSGLNLPYFDLSTTFVFAFVIYLFIVFHKMRQATGGVDGGQA